MYCLSFHDVPSYNNMSEIPFMNYQYDVALVHEGKKPFDCTLCVETVITRRKIHTYDSSKIIVVLDNVNF